ncbi:unnamed protein product [Effrenium voratum]|uniref:Uncharacterized protein n=1 Tax=Effrenium voratum TaxID=2562239 RepID=A0AA36IBB8_9DINO|nr:unnamed protein product [Effrenium voratum]
MLEASQCLQDVRGGWHEAQARASLRPEDRSPESSQRSLSRAIASMGTAPACDAGGFWMFQEDKQWLGFSPQMSAALEEVYQQWLQEEAGGALQPRDVPGVSPVMQYLAEFCCQGPKQRICRLSELHAAAVPVKKEARAEEIQALRRKVAELEHQAQQLLNAAPADGALLLDLQQTLVPGRFVHWEGLTGCVVACDSEAAIAFPDLEAAVWLPRAALRPDYAKELLSRPGSRVRYGRHERAVVCGRAAPFCAVVELLTPDGCKQRAKLQDLSKAAPSVERPAVGDLVTYKNGEELDGMVVQSNDLGLCIRCGLKRGIEDVLLSPAEADQALAQGVLRLSELNTLEPGMFVTRGEEVGVLFAIHADCSAVVDFIGARGWRGPLRSLAVLAAGSVQDEALAMCASISELLALSEAMTKCGALPQRLNQSLKAWPELHQTGQC